MAHKIPNEILVMLNEIAERLDHLALRLVTSWPTDHLPDLVFKIFSEFPLITGRPIEIYRSKFPDVLEFLEWDRIESIKSKVATPASAIDQLLSDFDAATGIEKTNYFGRLAKAFQMGLLSEEQKKKFGNTVWKNPDNTGFPADFPSVFKWFFLELPYPNGVSAKQSLHDYLKNVSFPTQQSSRPVNMTAGHISVCSEFIGASKMFAEIGWTSDDSENLFIKLSSWWDNDKKYLNESITKKEIDLADEYRARSKNIVNLLCVAIIPILSETALSKQEAEIMRVIQEMTALDIYTSEAMAQLFLRKRLESDKVYPSILTDALSNDPSRVRKAIIGIALLLKPGLHPLSHAEQENFVSVIVDAIKWRRSEAIVPALANLNEIIRYPVKLSNHQMKDVLLGLEYLIKDSNISYEGGQIASEYRLYAREMSAKLSFTLYQNLKSVGMQVPPVLEQWREICHDPREFAEIRNQWSR